MPCSIHMAMMKVAAISFFLTLWAEIAQTEVGVPNLESLINQHCASQCHKRLTERQHGNDHITATTRANAAAIEEAVTNALLNVKRSLYPTNCMDVRPESAKLLNDTGGVFTVYPLGVAIAEVYCDTTTDGGGWTVFQRRMDGSVDFFRGWDDYVRGFGERQGEFWLGLEAIHKMTTNGDYEMRVDMIQTNGTYRYAQYESFSIGPDSDYYRLSVSGYTGNATDGLEFHNNMRFSTKDSDHDTDAGSCASYYKGAWWYKSCYYSHLNAQYGKTNGNGIQWWRKVTPTGWAFPNVAMYLSFSEMKFRKKQ